MPTSRGSVLRPAFGSGTAITALRPISPMNSGPTCSRTMLTAILTVISRTQPLIWTTITIPSSIGLMLTTITMAFGTTSKWTVTSTLTTIQDRTTGISSPEIIVWTTTTTETTPMPTTTASTKRSGTAESCHKVSANPRSTTLTTTTMLSRTAKTLTTTTMDAWTLTRNSFLAVSGVKNNPPGTTTTTALSTGLMTTGTATV